MIKLHSLLWSSLKLLLLIKLFGRYFGKKSSKPIPTILIPIKQKIRINSYPALNKAASIAYKTMHTTKNVINTGSSHNNFQQKSKKLLGANKSQQRLTIFSNDEW